MGKTLRKVDPRTVRWAKGMDDKRKAHMLIKGVKHFRSNKCNEARADNEGNVVLDTWSECPSKSGRIAGRQIRNANKLNLRRRLEETNYA
jgi:hypothetical protein